MLKKSKKLILSFLSLAIAVTTVLQWDIDELKANEKVYESLLPDVSGMPQSWTNEMIQLTVTQNDTDYMYSFSDKEGYYNWQKENVSDTYGQNTTVYVAVMNQNGTISKERKVVLTKLDLFQPRVNVTYEEKNGNVVFTVDATDDLSGVKEYSFDGGLNYQISNTFIVEDQAEISIHVKDNAGNVKVYEKTYSIDASDEISIYSLTDTVDEEGNRYHEVTVENSSNSYEYNLDETNNWSNETTKLIPYDKDNEIILKRRKKSNGNARVVVEETQVMRVSSYPSVGGPAIIYEDGMIRLIGQGTAFNYTDTILDSYSGQYNIDGYNYQMKYSFDLETWTVYDKPFTLKPSDYGKTIYARLEGPNNGYISSEILYNEGVQKLVTAYQEHPSISDEVLTYGQIQDLLAAKYEFNYIAMQFENETNRYQYMVDSKNVIEIALTKNVYRAYENFTHMFATMQSPSNENAYVFSDLIGNKATYNIQTDELSYYDKDEELTYLMSVGLLNQIIDKNGNILTITRNSNTTIITDFNGRTYTINGDIVYMPSGTIVDGYEYKTSDDSLHDIDLSNPVESQYTTFLGMSVISRLKYDSGLYVDYEYSVEDDYYTIVTETTLKGTNTYYYDLQFNLVMEIDNYGNKSYYTYELDTNNLISERSNGVIIQYDYDNKGNVIKILEGNYRENNSNLEYEITEALTLTSEFTYDLHNRLISEKHSEENEKRYSYDTKGNLIRVQEDMEEGLQDIQILTYDNKGNVLTDTDVESNIMMTYTYDLFNNVLSVTTTDLSNTTDTSTITYTYDNEGRVLSETTSDYINTYVYNQIGNILLQEVNGQYTRNVYNDKGQLKIFISSDEYLAEEDGLSQSTKRDTYTNNSKGTRYSYTEDGQIRTELKRNTMVSVNVYDEYGNLQKKSIYNKQNYDSENDNYMYQIVYQPNGLIERYRVNGNTKVLNTYDENDNLIKVAYANSQNIQYTYSSEENPSNENYNNDDLLMSVKFKNDSSNRFTYSYDEEGNLTETVDVINNTKTEFNDKGYKLTNQSNSNEVIQFYENDGNKIKEEVLNNTYITEVNNDSITLKKNNVNVINSNKDCTSDGKLNSLQTTLYQGNQNVTLIEIPTYDKELISNYAIEGINNTTYNFQYTYDNNKNIKKEYGSFNNSFYTYDENNQLVRVIDSVNNRTTVFKYDARGNLIKEITYGKNDYADNGNNAAPLDEIDYTYGNTEWQDQLTKVNNSVITYDGAGNRTSYNGWTYTWEGGRQLASMSKDDTMITYKYDDNGIRTEKKVNEKTIRYTTIDGKITSQDDGINKLYFYYDEHDSLLGFEYNGTPYLYIKNIQGDIYGITDTSGTLLVQYKYDAWGQVESIIGNQVLGYMNPMRYRGYYYDEETELYYLQSRYYDASVRRFINADVFEMIGTNDSYISYNLYVYCGNSPVVNVDASGYWYLTITAGYFAYVFDFIMYFYGINTVFAAYQSFINKNFKKLSMNLVKNKVWGILGTIKNYVVRAIGSLSNSIYNFANLFFSSKTSKKIADYFKEEVLGRFIEVEKRKIDKIVEKVYKYLSCISSAGNFFATILDALLDNSLNGVIYIFGEK